MSDHSRLLALREEMKKQGINGFVIPHDDEFRQESLPESSKRLEWLTGFSGSAGTAVVLDDKAAIFVDGRYTLQAPKQVDGKDFEIIDISEKSPAKWLSENLKAGDKLGLDAWLHTKREEGKYATSCSEAGASLTMVDANPLDAAWKDRPEPPLGKIFDHPIEFSGVQSEYKRRKIAMDMKKNNQDAALITDPASVAWLLNIRGADVEYAPLPLSFAVLNADASVDLIVDSRKVDDKMKEILGDKVRIVEPKDFGSLLDSLGKDSAKVACDASGAPLWAVKRLENAGAKVVEAEDVCLLPRANKNKVEVEGAKAAHIRDGVALVKFMSWFSENAPKGGVSEISAAEKLEEFRKEHPLYRGPSFATIAGSGANGAIVHYSSTPETNRELKNGELFLLDSGGQYPDGTTDVTRTFAVGKAGNEEATRYTQVLKGMVDLTIASFPEGTSGHQLDAIARAPLWAEGLDYNHGTGHGVGSYLTVHEGPQGISKGARNNTALAAGMIVSNEPGFYEEGKFGIRIENLICVKEPKEAQRANLKRVMSFDTLTLAPFDRSLIRPELLEAKEVKWIDAYHEKVRETLSPYLDNKTKAWLKEATRPLAEKEKGGAKVLPKAKDR